MAVRDAETVADQAHSLVVDSVVQLAQVQYAYTHTIDETAHIESALRQMVLRRLQNHAQTRVDHPPGSPSISPPLSVGH